MVKVRNYMSDYHNPSADTQVKGYSRKKPIQAGAGDLSRTLAKGALAIGKMFQKDATGDKMDADTSANTPPMLRGKKPAPMDADTSANTPDFLRGKEPK